MMREEKVKYSKTPTISPAKLDVDDLMRSYSSFNNN